MQSTDWERIAEDMRRAKTARGRRSLGCFLAEGWRVTSRALSAHAPVRHLLIGRSAMAQQEGWPAALRAQANTQGCRLTVAPDEVLREFTEGRSFGDVMGLVALPTFAADAPCKPTHLPPTSVVNTVMAVDVLDPGNLGALMRTTLVSGANTLITVGGTDPFHPKAVRTSMGSIFRLKIRHEATLETALEITRKEDVETIALVPEGGTPLPLFTPLRRSLALLIGGEAHGLPAAAIARADAKVSIPMAPLVDSYSLNAATAIALYALRQRAEDDGPSDCSESM
jgi:TrmH family RNA methyltransferase